MAKVESTFLNMVISLVLITGCAAALLAGVFEVTKTPIAFSEKSKQVEAIRQVTSSFDNSPLEEAFKVAIADGDSLTVFPIKNNGKMTGAAVESGTTKGFSGAIRVMVGFNVDGSVRNYVVLHHSETPGLGSKMQEWFSDHSRPGQCVIGKNLQKPLRVKKDGGEVDAITAATISSRAFLDAINRAHQAYRLINYKEDAKDSASVHHKGNKP